MSDYDLRLISLGAGVQSSCLPLLADDGVIEADCAVFADTRDERGATYDWLDKLDAATSTLVYRPSKGSLRTETLRSMDETPSQFVPIPTYVLEPDKSGESMGRRQCTRWAKIDVVYQQARRLVGLSKGQRRQGERVEVLIGISTDEADRAKPSQHEPFITNRHPLLELGWSREDCKRYLLDRMGELPPKSSCYYCPYKSDRDWIELREEDPAAWSLAVEFEREMRERDPRQFLHVSCKPLEDVRFDPSRQLDLFGNECEGMCGV